jgi:hypothetical protein
MVRCFPFSSFWKQRALRGETPFPQNTPLNTLPQHPQHPLQPQTINQTQKQQTDYLADQKGRRREDVESWTPYPGGAPANVATALARLGVKVEFASALGRDEMGDAFMALLEGAYVVRCVSCVCAFCVHALCVLRACFVRCVRM